MEAAARRRVGGRRHVPFQQYPLLGSRRRTVARDGREQRLCVGVAGTPVEAVGRPVFHQLADVHHRHPIAEVVHDRQVVGDEQEGESQLALQVAQQANDLRLHRNVERGNRLVAHHELRLQAQRPGDADALPLAARELVRIAVQVVAAHAHRFHQRLYPLLAVRELVDQQVLAHHLAHRHARVQRRERILEDHLHPAPHLEHALARQCQQVRHRSVHAVAHGAIGGAFQANERASQGALAAAALAHQAERLAPANGQVDAVHRLDLTHYALQEASLDGKPGTQVLRLQQGRFGGSGGSRGWGRRFRHRASTAPCCGRASPQAAFPGTGPTPAGNAPHTGSRRPARTARGRCRLSGPHPGRRLPR